MDKRREEKFFISDKSSYQYRVDFVENRRWHFKVWDGITRVGYANCHLEHSALYVDDLQIANNARRPRAWHIRFLRLLSRPNECINYRNRGVGGALLRLIATLAAEQELTAIEGSLSTHDLMDNPDLPRWYRRLGFAVLPGGRYGSGKVRLELLNRESGTSP